MSTDQPSGLSARGRLAYKTIMAVMEDGIIETGGCTTFYSPAEWIQRGEQYGTTSVLVVVYDGGSVRDYFDSYGGYALMESMRQALQKVGLYAERCTGWYSAIYEL